MALILTNSYFKKIEIIKYYNSGGLKLLVSVNFTEKEDDQTLRDKKMFRLFFKKSDIIFFN